MRKSELTRKHFTGRKVCQYESMKDGKCHDRAAVTLTITSFPTGRKPITRDSILCGEHADTTIGTYEREWARYPEMFEDR